MESKVGFKLVGLKSDQFAIFEENYSEKKKTELITNLDFGINSNEKQVVVYATFTFEQSKKAFIKIRVSCQFKVEPKAWESFVIDGKIIFPKGFISHLAVLTIGSTRGVLHAKTEGTSFNKFLLPTIDVTNLINSDAEFELSENQ